MRSNKIKVTKGDQSTIAIVPDPFGSTFLTGAITASEVCMINTTTGCFDPGAIQETSTLAMINQLKIRKK